jgi:hypothetical protein
LKGVTLFVAVGSCFLPSAAGFAGVDLCKELGEKSLECHSLLAAPRRDEFSGLIRRKTRPFGTPLKGEMTWFDYFPNSKRRLLDSVTKSRRASILKVMQCFD